MPERYASEIHSWVLIQSDILKTLVESLFHIFLSRFMLSINNRLTMPGGVFYAGFLGKGLLSNCLMKRILRRNIYKCIAI
jgi:hypothetical protein